MRFTIIERLRGSPIAPGDSLRLRRRGSIGGVPDKQTEPTTGSRRPLQPQQLISFASLSRQRFPGFPGVLNASVARRYRPETARDGAVRSGASRSCSYCPQTSSGAQRFKSDTTLKNSSNFLRAKSNRRGAVCSTAQTPRGPPQIDRARPGDADRVLKRHQRPGGCRVIIH